MYKKISDYGIVGNLHSIALIGLDGSIDWLCMPHIDSPSIFAALLDSKKGGRFSVHPGDEWDSVAEYIPGTNILQTRFRVGKGIMRLTDFMPVNECGCEELEEQQHELYRLIEVLEGHVNTDMIFDPQFNYARDETKLTKDENGIVASANGESISLSCTRNIDLNDDHARAQWNLTNGDKVWLVLKYGDNKSQVIDPAKMEKSFQDTKTYWQSWLGKSETGRAVHLGPFKDMVERSALVLKLLYYEPEGTIAAAATTSLPEVIGGERNWDYRYTWVRDTSFTLQALFNLGHLSETEGYLRWIEKLLSEHGAGKMQIMYGLRGEEDLPEEELTHLEGYKGSKPVRIGNEAAKQKQLDIYGELMDAVLKLSDYVGKIDSSIWPFLRDVCDYVVEHWRDSDFGIWEVRGGPYQFVYSKVMCWLALDRGITIARRYGFHADLKKWDTIRSDIKNEVLQKGWSEKKKAFVQHYDTDNLDSSNLLIPILGFLPVKDPRVVSTIEAIQRELSHDGFIYRYEGDDGLSGKEGTFLLCTFWMIDNLIALGRNDEAESLLRRAENTSNHLGLFSEQYDVVWKLALGNFPQAFTHIGYINSVIAFQQARCMSEGEEEKKSHPHKRFILSNKIVLNDGQPGEHISSNEISKHLKKAMNVLRGAFFDTKKGRVAYERMKHSEAYAGYLEKSYALKNMDLNELSSREDKIAFWINLYNVIVVHGVVELGIRDSVKEVRNFFKRIQYRVGDMFFSPEDIEHGLLRNNRRPPNSFFKMFGSGDERLQFSVEPIDPRIHFALVCASSSCPPISFYTADNLDTELTIAARTFLNSGGAVIDIERGSVSLSRIFKWYAGDFAKNHEDLLKTIVPYLYDEEKSNYIKDNTGNIKIEYQEYDWRLNRY